MYEEVSLGELQQLISKVEAAESVLDGCLARWFTIGLIAADTLRHVSLLNKLKICNAFMAQFVQEPVPVRALQGAIKRTADSQLAWDRALRACVERNLVRAAASNYELRELSIALVGAISELSETILTTAPV